MTTQLDFRGLQSAGLGLLQILLLCNGCALPVHSVAPACQFCPSIGHRGHAFSTSRDLIATPGFVLWTSVPKVLPTRLEPDTPTGLGFPASVKFRLSLRLPGSEQASGRCQWLQPTRRMTETGRMSRAESSTSQGSQAVTNRLRMLWMFIVSTYQTLYL